MADDDENAGGASDEGPAPGKDGGESEEKSGTPGQEKPEDADPGDQFSDAIGDPLADAFGGSAGSSADQAYRTGIRTVQSTGPATVIGGGRFRDLNVGGTTVYMYNRREQAPGRVRDEVLEDLIQRYVPVAGYDELVKRLQDGQLVVLRGTPGTGRATTGLRMLAEAANGNVSRFDPETDLRSLGSRELEPGFGYLLELPQSAGAPPTAVQVDRLHALLCERSCFMVVISPHHSRYRAAFDDYAVDCPLPDPHRLLERAIEHAAQAHPDLAPELRELAADPRLRPRDTTMLPSGVFWLVKLIVAHAAGEVTFDEVAHGSSESLGRHVSEWFEPLSNVPASAEADEQVRLGAFRIALAVFNETPFDLVAEAGELLAWRFLKARSPRRTPGRPVFANRRDDYVADSRARLLQGSTKFGRTAVPSAFVAYTDDRMPAAVLGCVWNMHNVRGPLILWLQSLSNDRRPFVWMRAALAIGLLSSWDFAYTFHELIDPWARSAASEDPDANPARRRLVAAVALDTASRNDNVLPVIREMLKDWCRKGTTERRWTGAAALGYDLGVRYVATSLKDLRIAGCWEDGKLASVASWAIARIFARGGINPVLKALGDWLIDDRRTVRQLGLLVTWRIAEMKVADVEDLDLTIEAGGGRWTRLAERDRWPLLVALAADDPALLDSFVDVVWQMARAAPAQKPVLDVLGSWMRAGQKDRSCVGPVGQFLALLGDDESDRARLLHLIDVLRRDRDEPLPNDIADRLASAIETNIHTMDE